jgi:adenosylcobyric acid synthase
VGVIAVPHMSNFTDFDALSAEPSISVAFLRNSQEACWADIIILPGSKQTLDDLEWLRDRGFAGFLAAYSGLLIGICGGLQMLGISIEDPLGVESNGISRTVSGLGMLGIRTVMHPHKTVRLVTGYPNAWAMPSFTGYEIHMGETLYENGTVPFAKLLPRDVQHPTLDGAISAQRKVWGTYVHGLFDADEFRHEFLKIARQSSGLAPTRDYVCVSAKRQARIDRWAGHLRQSLDMNLIGGWATGR